MVDAADNTWTIAVATGSTALPPDSPPLRHSGGGLNVVARHVLLALYLHHRDLHLPDLQLPAPETATLTPKAWANTAPEEIAAYLRITCRRFNTDLGRQKRNTLPTQRTPLPGTPPPSDASEAPGGLGVLSGRPPGRPRRDHRHADGPHGRAHLRQWPRGAPPRGAPLARPLPVAPTGTRGFTRPRQPPGQEDQDRSGDPKARLPAGRHTPTRARVQPHRTTPRPDPRGTPTAQAPPAPAYRSTQTLQPSQPPPPAHVHTMPGPPYAQSQGTWHHHHHHHDPVPPNPYPLMPQYYSHAHKLHPHHAPAQPGPTNQHTPHGTHHRTTASRIPPPPAPTTTPTDAGVPHTASTRSTPPPSGPAQPNAPTTRAHDTRATVHPHGPAGGRARTPATRGPSRGAPPPPAAPPPTPHTREHHPPAAGNYIRTTAPPGRPCGHLPPTPQHRNQPGTARTARRTQATSARPTGTPRPPASTASTPAPPTTNRPPPHHPPLPPPPPPPPETRPETQHTAAPTSKLMSMPPRTHTTASPSSRGRHKKPHHLTPHATTTTAPPTPHHASHHIPTTRHRTGRTLRPTQPRSGTAAPPGTRGPGGATPPHLQHHPAHPGDHPGPGGHPGGKRTRLPLRRIPPRHPTRPPPARHPRRREPAPHGGPNLAGGDT